jgi:Holliday junction DNA helicase RuvB
LIAATTRPGRITLPLRERFGFSPRLDYYSASDLTMIVARSAGILEVKTDGDGAAEIARRSRGTPRIANRLLRRVRDFAEVRHQGAISGDIARGGSGNRGRRGGLDRLDHAILRCIIDVHGPVGLYPGGRGRRRNRHDRGTWSQSLQLGFQRTLGKVATSHAYRYLGTFVVYCPRG